MKRKNIMCVMRNAEKLSDARNGYVVRDPATDTVQIAWTQKLQYTQYLTDLSTRDARLLAKRINQFLDGGG